MTQYVALTYAIGLALLWGYAASLWLRCKSQARHSRRNAVGTASAQGGVS
jgi:hypothetical protein